MFNPNAHCHCSLYVVHSFYFVRPIFLRITTRKQPKNKKQKNYLHNNFLFMSRESNNEYLNTWISFHSNSIQWNADWCKHLSKILPAVYSLLFTWKWTDAVIFERNDTDWNIINGKGNILSSQNGCNRKLMKEANDADFIALGSA